VIDNGGVTQAAELLRFLILIVFGTFSASLIRS
jgi:hypothetical protein